ncbi:MAG: hypothetical protein CVU97_04730 [Firmicutes bacterium HGW-Firmicutes-21]|nr:MAG: hypothetical protein CVU97_04730 [Firmicutes bacterium HGW-Firmicutes-21]
MDIQVSQQQCKLDMHGLKKVFIGLLIIIFDLRANGFNIIPDIIGYIFIMSALNSLGQYNIKFRKAKTFAAYLIFMSVFDLYKINIYTESTFLIVFFILWSLLYLVLDLILIYYICDGTRQIAIEYNEQGIADKYKTWVVYIIGGRIISYFGFLFFSNIVYLIPFILIDWFTIITFLILLKKGFEALQGKTDRNSYICE